ncbi:MAG TPA: methionyl-tRNA formyltransferase [Lachnospiraceae bacterium]
MRLVFMGTPDFAVGTLKEIINAGHEVLCVVTQEDKPKGRGKQMQITPVKEVALEHNLPILQPQKIRAAEHVDYLKSLEPDVIVVVAFGQIIPQEILDIPKYGCLNVHASILPDYRGAAPIQWAVLDGVKESGVTIMKMDAGLDTGDMISIEKLLLDEEETSGSLFGKLSALGAKALVRTLEDLEKGVATFTKQPKESPTPYAKMIDKSMGEIDWTWSALKIERWVRGMNPWPSAFTHIDGKTLKIWQAKAGEEKKDSQGLMAGEIVDANKKEILVKTGEGLLAIQSLQLEGKKRMEVSAFLNGFTLKRGQKLGQK